MCCVWCVGSVGLCYSEWPILQCLAVTSNLTRAFGQFRPLSAITLFTTCLLQSVLPFAVFMQAHQMHCPHFTGAGSIYLDGALLSYTQVEAAFEYFKSNGTIVNIAHVDDVRVRTTTGEHRFELRMGHREPRVEL